MSRVLRPSNHKGLARGGVVSWIGFLLVRAMLEGLLEEY